MHVIGAGAMGGDIAAWCAWHGFTVTLADMKPEPLAGAIKRAAELFGKIGRDNRREIRDALDRLIPDLKGEGVAHRRPHHRGRAGKARSQAESLSPAIEPKMKPGAILATNTSSIPLEQLRDGSEATRTGSSASTSSIRSRACSWSRSSATTGRRTMCCEDARAFLGRIDRLPAPVKSAPGFLVNRALTPYLLEAMVMLDEGVKKETIDQAAEDFGMPMGPIELADQVGLDICLHVAEMLQSQSQPADARSAAMAEGQGRQRRARQEDRQGPL